MQDIKKPGLSPNDMMMTVRVTKELHHKFKVLAAKAGMPITKIIQQFMEKMVEQDEEKKND